MYSTKFLKPHKPKLPSICVFRGRKGRLGLQSLSTGTISTKQMEACRQNINRRLKRKGQIVIHGFADRGRSLKPCEVRMGKGKGKIDHYEMMVSPGKLILEIVGISENLSRYALQGGATKLGVSTKII